MFLGEWRPRQGTGILGWRVFWLAMLNRVEPNLEPALVLIRNHTCWLPSASSAAPNQRIRPLGSRVGSRGVRVWAAPGQSSRVRAMTIGAGRSLRASPTASGRRHPRRSGARPGRRPGVE